MISRGDKVSVLDEAVDGVVISVEKDQVTIETSDGFTMTYFVNELIKINNSSNLEQSIRSFDSTKIKKKVYFLLLTLQILQWRHLETMKNL